MSRERLTEKIRRIALTFTTLTTASCGVLEGTKKPDIPTNYGDPSRAITTEAVKPQNPQVVVIPYGSDLNFLQTFPPSEKKAVIAPYGSEVVKDSMIITPFGSETSPDLLVRNLGQKTPAELDRAVRYYFNRTRKEEPQQMRYIYFINRKNDIAYAFTLTPGSLQTHLQDGQYPPVPPSILVNYWNGRQAAVTIPENIWRNAFDACAWINGGIYDPKVCSVGVLLGIRITENDLQNPVSRQPQSGACGPYQFMDGTWVMYAPDVAAEVPDFSNNCLDERDSAFVAAKMTKTLGLHEQETEEDFVRRFAGLDGGLVWNKHAGQARTVWKIKEKVEKWINNPNPQIYTPETPRSFSTTIEKLPPTCPNCVALTFDTEEPDCTYFQIPQDKQNCYGPETYLPKLLDVLDQYKVRATFFIQGKWAEAYPQLVREIARRGHLIANHGYSHPYYSEISRAERKADIEAGKEAIEKAGVPVSEFFRLPYGDGWWEHTHNPKIEADVESTGQISVGWSVDSRDWQGLPAEEIFSNATRAGNLGIILFHPHSPHLVDALPDIIEFYKAKNLTLVTLRDAISERSN